MYFLNPQFQASSHLLSLYSPIFVDLVGNLKDSFSHYLAHMNHVVREPGLRTRADTNRAVQPQNMARGLKVRIQEVKGLYYLCSENKGADQLWG